MSWSITLGRVFGSEIRIHLTFLILLAWIGIVHWQQGGANAAFEGIAFIIAVFACVTLHELGHALAARRYGITTPDITLLPIGGLARLSRMPEDPGQEIVIALAGPAVNVVIAAILLLLPGVALNPEVLSDVGNPADAFLTRLAAINIWLVLFNLIPAFPMDGGRVLRAVLALRMGRRSATEWAARIGQGLAFAFGFLGLIGGNPFLVFIAIFVYLAASAEAQGTGLMDMARRMKVDDAMIRSFQTLGPQSTIDDAAEALIRTTQHEFPVVDGAGRLRGMLTRNAMIRAMKESGAGTAVLEAMEPDVPTLRAGERLHKALNLMQEKGSTVLGVVDEDGRLQGYISQDNLSELMMLDAAEWHTLQDRKLKPAKEGPTAPGPF